MAAKKIDTEVIADLQENKIDTIKITGLTFQTRMRCVDVELVLISGKKSFTEEDYAGDYYNVAGEIGSVIRGVCFENVDASAPGAELAAKLKGFKGIKFLGPNGKPLEKSKVRVEEGFDS